MGASRDFGSVSDEHCLSWSSIDPLSGNDTTVAMWCRVDNFDTYGVVFFGTNSGASTWWQVASTEVFIHSSAINYSSGLDDGNWHHIAFTSDAAATERIFYLDGVNVASASSLGTAVASSSSKNFQLGRWIGGSSWTLDGNLAHFHLCDRALSEAEVNQIMRYPGTIECTMYLPIFGNVSPEPDRSGNGFHASVTGTSESSDGPPVSFGVPPQPVLKFYPAGSISVPVLQGNLALSPNAPTVGITNHKVVPIPQSDLVVITATPSTGLLNDHDIPVFKGNSVLSSEAPGAFKSTEEHVTVPRGDSRLQQTFYPVGVKFDGSTTYLARGADLTGSLDTKKVTFAFWARFPEASISNVYTAGATRFEINIRSHGKVNIVGRNSANTTILRATSVNVWDDNEWHHFVGSFDLAEATRKHLYVDGVNDLESTIHTNDSIDMTLLNHAIGGSVIATLLLDGDLADFWLDQGVYIDLNDPANLAKFYDKGAVDLGVDGSNPIGTSPVLFFSGDVATWHTNKGTGGGFAEFGALTRSSGFGPGNHAPAVRQDSPIDLVSGDLALGSIAGLVSEAVIRDLTPGSLTLNTGAITVAIFENVQPPAGDVAIFSDLPTIFVDSTADLTVPVRALDLTTFAPTAFVHGWVNLQTNAGTWVTISPTSTDWLDGTP